MSAKLARERATENLLTNLLPRVIFSEEPSPSIICLLCNQVLKNPMQLSCGHRVCKVCEENFLPNASGERHCPNDGELIERTFPDGSALKEVMLLECSCVAHQEGCAWKGELLELEGHVNGCDFCAEAKCPYEELHCTFSGTQQRMTAHIRDESIRHDCLVATCMKDCMDHTVSNRSLLNTIRKGTVSNDNTIQQLEAEVNQLQQYMVQTSAECDPDNSQQQHIKEKSEELQNLLIRSEEKKNKLFAMHTKIEELLANIEIQMATLTNVDDADTTRENLAATKKQLLDKVKRLGEFNDTHGKQINEVGIKIRIAQCSNNNGNYTWKLDNLNKRFNEGATGELYTPPLYTSNFGYKYSAKVILGGDKRKGWSNTNHMAFYIVLMQGDYDELLQFPFPYPVKITLVNQSNKPDITHTLYPDPNKLHFQKPYKNMNPAIGFARFCSHQMLSTGGFIKNDTIYFRIVVQKVGSNEPNIEPSLRP